MSDKHNTFGDLRSHAEGHRWEEVYALLAETNNPDWKNYALSKLVDSVDLAEALHEGMALDGVSVGPCELTAYDTLVALSVELQGMDGPIPPELLGSMGRVVQAQDNEGEIDTTGWVMPADTSSQAIRQLIPWDRTVTP